MNQKQTSLGHTPPILKIRGPILNMDWSSYYLIYYDFDRACLPGDMVRACSLSLISFPRASARCKIAIRNVF